MELQVLGCHGGETLRHRTGAFLLDQKSASDVGALTTRLEFEEQYRPQAAVVRHAHLDHIRDLATLADNRWQADCPTLPIGGMRATIATLKKHFFNSRLWPDFTMIPSSAEPTLRWGVVPAGEKLVRLGDHEVRGVPVSHTIDATTLLIRGSGGSLA